MNKLILPIFTALVLATVLLAVPLYFLETQPARSVGGEGLPSTILDESKSQFGIQSESTPTSGISNYSSILYMVALSMLIAITATSLIIRVQRRTL
ncbi:MAG: hypothetical protein QXJ17_02380 [Nitrososphaeria archaeon]